MINAGARRAPEGGTNGRSTNGTTTNGRKSTGANGANGYPPGGNRIHSLRRPPSTRNTAIGAVLALVSLLVTGVAASSSANAATNLTIAVTTTADTVDPIDGLTSLREAIDQANATWNSSPPPGQVSPTPDTITITLASSTNYTLDRCAATTDDEDTNATGDLDITVKPPLTILGNSSTVANACPGQRLLHRPDGNFQTTPLTLDRLTVTSGQGAPGLAIYHYGELTLRDTTVTLNQRPSNLGSGVAAIAFRGTSTRSPVVIERSEISHTTSAAGVSTAHSVSSLTITDSVVTDNANPNGGFNVAAAGVNIDAGTTSAAITRSTFRRNNQSSSTIPPATWPGDLPPEPTNTQTGLGGGFAGALYAQSSQPEQFAITDSVFEDNQGGRAGGVHGPFSIARSIFRRNVGHVEGAASVQGAITDSTFEANLTMWYGAASSPTIRRSSFINNRTGGTGAAVGVYLSPDQPSLIENSTLVGNRGRSGGAVGIHTNGLLPPTAALEIRGSTFNRNQAVLSSSERSADIRVDSGLPLQNLKLTGTVLGSSAQGDGVPSCSRRLWADRDAEFESGGGNVFTDTSCVTTLDPTDLVVPDAMIGPVADNGGPTPTAAPLPGSPVRERIAATDPTCTDPTAIDQRGQPRRQGLGCDAGAVEVAWSGYHPVAPTRIYDSRDGGDSNRLGPGQQRTIPVLGVGSIPPTGVSSIVVNTTVTSTTATSHLSLWPTGTSTTTTSTLNWAAGDTNANLTTVLVDPTTGTIQARNNSGHTHLILDIAGWYDTGTTDPNLLIVPPTPTKSFPLTSSDEVGDSSVQPSQVCPCGDAYHPVTPTRIFDTRIGTGTPSGTIGPDQSRIVSIHGAADVPTTATAAIVSVTGVYPSLSTHLTLFPTGGPLPGVSNLNLSPGTVIPNLAIVPIGADGTVTIHNNSGSLHTIIDLVAYFAPGPGARFLAVPPTRVVDTREPPLSAPFVGGSIYEITFEAPIVAMSANLTGTQPTAATHLTMWPAAQALPDTSNLNLITGQTRAVATITPASPTSNPNQPGTLAAIHISTNSGTTHAILDANGFFA